MNNTKLIHGTHFNKIVFLLNGPINTVLPYTGVW